MSDFITGRLTDLLYNFYLLIYRAVRFIHQLVNLAFVFFNFGLLLQILRIVFRLGEGEDWALPYQYVPMY